MIRLFTTCCLVAACAILPAADQSAPVELDHCGIEWVRPFDQALAAAREQNRLLLIKPIAFGTNEQGCW